MVTGSATRIAAQVVRASGEGAFTRIGGTPLLRLERVAAGLPPSVALYGKAEWYNPSGSVKDRPAAAIIRQALQDGSLTPNRTLLDSSSGNMGIAYATLCAALGLRVQLMVPANASPERLAILHALGAGVTLTDPLEGADGARQVAAEEAAHYPERYFFANQYDNDANWQSHYETTAPELVRQTGGRMTHLVVGMGTTGTVVGVGRYLRETLPRARLVAVQPDAPLHGLEGLKHLASSPKPGIYDPQLPHEIVEVRTESAYAMARTLARQDGLLVGVSAAAAVVAARQVAEQLDEGVVVALLPDSGLKYLSEAFWSAV